MLGTICLNKSSEPPCTAAPPGCSTDPIVQCVVYGALHAACGTWHGTPQTGRRGGRPAGR